MMWLVASQTFCIDIRSCNGPVGKHCIGRSLVHLDVIGSDIPMSSSCSELWLLHVGLDPGDRQSQFQGLGLEMQRSGG